MYPRVRAIVFLVGFFLSVAASANTVKLVKTPGPYLTDDITKTQVKLNDNYRSTYPHILFGPEDIPSIKAKAKKLPDIYKEVKWQADHLDGNLPTGTQIREGYKYWRAEWILSGAMAYTITENDKYLSDTIKWMQSYCAEDIWGVKYNSNHDLEASWYLYYISLSYDLLHDHIPAKIRGELAESLKAHSQAIYDAKSSQKKFTFDQNHMYIPITALTTGALALSETYPELAEQWLNFSAASMNRSRYVLGSDGFYYEGSAYWLYAMHWHIRYADMMQRVAGKSYDFFDLPAFTLNHHFGQHTYLPGSPYAFDFGDTGMGPRQRPESARGAWASMLYRTAAATSRAEHWAVAEKLRSLGNNDDPSMALLWYPLELKGKAKFEDAKPYHYFEDHGIVFWRSSWADDAKCYMFKAGPPLGHKAATKLEQLKDWSPNTGHVHPDIGMFWIFSGGQPLSMDTGYLYKKHTDDHSTLLVDGLGVGSEDDYRTYKYQPYSRYSKIKILACDLNDDYGYVAADMGCAWEDKGTGQIKIVRHILMTEQCVLVVDEIESEKPHQYSFLINTESEKLNFNKNPSGWGNYYDFESGSESLKIYPIAPGSDRRAIQTGPNMVWYGRGPQTGEKVATGGQMRIVTNEKVSKCRYVVLMVPAGSFDMPPQTKVLRNDQQAFELRYNFERFGIDLTENSVYFNPSRGNSKPLTPAKKNENSSK